MPEFLLSREIKVGDLLTAGSVALATLTLFYALAKDRLLRRREYADRIRISAAATLAAIERWREIAIRHFHDAQPLLTDADIMLVKEQDITATRDALWRALVALEAQTSARVLSEKLEGAYSGLYGYDPTVQVVYSTATARLRAEFDAAHLVLLDVTQSDVIGMKSAPRPYISAILGNRLRASTSEIKQRFSERAEEALEPLRAKMLALVRASDATIMRKRLSEIRRDQPNT